MFVNYFVCKLLMSVYVWGEIHQHYSSSILVFKIHFPKENSASRENCDCGAWWISTLIVCVICIYLICLFLCLPLLLRCLILWRSIKIHLLPADIRSFLTLNPFDTMWSPPFYKRWPCNGDQLVPKGLCIGERESFSSNRSNGSGSEWIWIERQRIERCSTLPLYVSLSVYFYVPAHFSVFVSMTISLSRSFLMRSIFKMHIFLSTSKL